MYRIDLLNPISRCVIRSYDFPDYIELNGYAEYLISVNVHAFTVRIGAHTVETLRIAA